MQFHFRNKESDQHFSSCLLFAKKDKIISFDYNKNELTIIYDLSDKTRTKPLKDDPLFFQPNNSQESFILSNNFEGIFIKATGNSSNKIYNSQSVQDIDAKNDEYQEENEDVGKDNNGLNGVSDNIQGIKKVIYDDVDRVFYVMANRYKHKLGLFIIKINENKSFTKYHYLTKIKNNLDIDDANMHVMRDYQNKTKELVLSYKTIYTNTYNLSVMDLSGGCNEKTHQESPLIQRHLSFQLWESKCMGILVQQTRDYVILNKDGVNVTILGDTHSKKFLKIGENNYSSNIWPCLLKKMKNKNKDKKQKQKLAKPDMMIHSLNSVDHLKINPHNFIEFDFTDDRVGFIQVQHKHVVKSSECGQIREQKELKAIDHFFQESQEEDELETQFENLISFKIDIPTLRELLLMQSLQRLSTQAQIMQYVQEQPEPLVFLKSFLELNGSNFLSILSFDSSSVSALLDDKNKKYFSGQYPLFYKNKICKKKNKQKYFYRSAIDSALKNNQITGLNCMIKYLVQNQNNYITSFLFSKTLSKLAQKGVCIHLLLLSDIFVKELDFDEWDSAHTCKERCLMPYHGSIFDLRKSYKVIFHDKKFKEIDPEKEESSKVYKIKYKINLLPSFCLYQSERDGKIETITPKLDFIQECQGSEELKIFETQAMKDLIEFKWLAKSRMFHLGTFCFHLFYLTCIFIYVTDIYSYNNFQQSKQLLVLMTFGVVEPLVYETYQLYDQGLIKYFTSFYNWFDFGYNWSGVVFILLNYFYSPFEIQCKVVIMILILCSIIKTLFFMRIITSLTPLVTLMTQVLIKLKSMLIFLFMLIIFFSQFLAVLGLSNYKIEGKLSKAFDDGDFLDTCLPCLGLMLDKDQDVSFDSHEYPYEAYGNVNKDQLNMVMANLIHTFRMSLGDFDFQAVIYLNKSEAQLFWLVWTLIVTVTMIIFINFIIAEASTLFEDTMKVLDTTIQQGKTDLICESEQMTPNRIKRLDWYPKYIISREIQA